VSHASYINAKREITALRGRCIALPNALRTPRFRRDPRKKPRAAAKIKGWRRVARAALESAEAIIESIATSTRFAAEL